MRREYEDLANAIIIQAVKDYRDALHILVRHPENKVAKAEKRSIEYFFRSPWFTVLTNLNGQILIKQIKEEFKTNDTQRISLPSKIS